MANPDPRGLYFHQATAFGVSGQIDRPLQQTIPIQASVTLAGNGGHGTDRIDNYELRGIVSFSAAYVDVGGSFDSNTDTHTTYASSVIEKLNIFNVVLADRIVSRTTVYHPTTATADAPSKLRFSITGSYFDNLRINGQKIDAKLDQQTFHESTYEDFCDGGGDKPSPNSKALLGSNIDLGKLSSTDHNYAVVQGIADRFKEWDAEKKQPMQGHHFWCSAANGLSIPSTPSQQSSPPNSPPSEVANSGVPAGLVNFGGIICVPRFGVVYLAELLVYKNHRHLTMIRVHMCSPGDGFIGGGGTGGGGGGNLPPT